MPNRLTDLNVEYVSLVDRAAVRNADNPTEPQRFLVWKAERGDPDPTGGTMTEAEIAALAKAEKDASDAQAALAKAETEKAELATRVEALEKAAKPEDKPAPLNKADLPEPVRLALEKAEADTAAANARIEKAEKQAEEDRALAKAERDTRLTREFVAKAQTFTSLSVDAEKFGPILKSASEKLTKEEVEELDRVLKAADAQLATSNLLKSAGVGGDAQPRDGEQDLTQKAEELRKSDPSLTKFQAMQRAMRENPEAQARYAASR
jgi:hypothetical protein